MTQESIRTGCFLINMSATLQEFVRVVYYYFAKGYDSEHALREMTENGESGGATLQRSSAHSLYVFARDRISRY